MRILHVHSGNLYGGVETLLWTLARYRDLCPSVDHEFALCFQGRISQELASAGMTVHRLGAVRIRHPLSVHKARERLRRILVDGKFDLMVCHMAWAYGVFAASGRRAGTPVLLWLHDTFGARNWIGWWIGRQRPRAIIANSQFTKTSWDGVFQGSPVNVIRYPVTCPHPAADFNRRAVRERFGADDDTVALIQISRMQPWKGHSTLLAALALLGERRNWVCWIAGGAQRLSELRYVESLQKLAAELRIAERVRFIGERRDIADLLAAADVCCQANAAPEPFGIAFIEALYSGLPVVTSAFGGAVEVVTPDCGILTAPNNAESFANSLASLVDDRRRLAELASAARKRAASLCDPTLQMEKLNRSFAEALGTVETPAGQSSRSDAVAS